MDLIYAYNVTLLKAFGKSNCYHSFSNQRQKTVDVVKVHGLGLSKVEGSGIPGGEVKFIDTRRKTDGEGISLSLS